MSKRARDLSTATAGAFTVMGVAQPPRHPLRDAMRSGDEMWPASQQDAARVTARLNLLESATTAEELARDVDLAPEHVEWLSQLYDRPRASWKWAKMNGWELAEGGFVVHMARAADHDHELFDAGDKPHRERRS